MKSYRIGVPSGAWAMALPLLLLGCGGGGGDALSPPADSVVQPTFHVANVLPPEPSAIDADGSDASANVAPGKLTLPAGVDAWTQGIATGQEVRRRSLSVNPSATKTTQGALPATVSYYRPAQIRAAYGFAQLPGANAINRGAYQGAGQTIAIVDAFHNPNIANDLQVFSQTFGLQTCAPLSLTPTVHLPLASATTDQCTFSVVFAASGGTMRAAPPAVNGGWATESSLDVEWAHAIAPLARIILVEAASNTCADLLDAVTLAAKLGATTVSMSWGGPEFGTQLDGYFSKSGTTFVASSGDSGVGVAWPAVVPNVLAVGGTHLNYSGSSNSRQETAWSGSGGGYSSRTPAPSWQTNGRATRSVPDVAYNADPSSGVLVYLTQSSTTGGAGWLIVGGTSAGAPQWAALIGIADAVRALSGIPAYDAPSLKRRLYQDIGGNPAAYARDLQDVTDGSDGSCSTCAATVGYDTVTGWGTPNAQRIVDDLAPIRFIHYWGENDRKANVGDLFAYDNPYDGRREYFTLQALGGDGRYWYFPVDTTDNYFWYYSGTDYNGRTLLKTWGDDDRRASVGDFFVYDNPFDGRREYFRLQQLGGDGRYGSFPINQKDNYFWQYMGTSRP